MAYVCYKPVDLHMGISSPDGVLPAKGYKAWSTSQTWVVGDIVTNGGFAFMCSVAGAGAVAGGGPAPGLLTDNAATWVLLGAISPLCAKDTTQQVELGSSVCGVDPTFGTAEFVYVKYGGAVVAGDFVVLSSSTGKATQLPIAAPGAGKYTLVGIAMGNGADGTFGWVMVRGVHDYANVTAALTTAQAVTGGGASAGRVNQGVANYYIDGTDLLVAGVAGAGTVLVNYPECGGRST